MVFALSKIYCDGDSWSVITGNHDDLPMGYWFGNALGRTMENYGHAGKSVDKTIRNTQRHVLANKDKDYFYFVGIGHTQRFDTSDGETLPNHKYLYEMMISEQYVQSVSVDFLQKQDRSFAECFFRMFEYPFLEYQTLSKLIMLHDFLTFHGVDFIIHNIGFDYDYDPDYEFGKQFLHEVEQRPRMINFFENSFHSYMRDNGVQAFNHKEYGWMGHFESEGHKLYADFLLEKYRAIHE